MESTDFNYTPWPDDDEPQPTKELPAILEERLAVIESKVAAWLTALFAGLVVLGVLAWAHLVSILRSQ